MLDQCLCNCCCLVEASFVVDGVVKCLRCSLRDRRLICPDFLTIISSRQLFSLQSSRQGGC